MALSASALAGCSNGESPEGLTYPETRKMDVVDTYFGTQVPDPYRWLEDDRSPETGAWVEAQNKVTFGYLDQIPYRDSIKDRLRQLWNYPRRSAPYRDGGHYFHYRNDGLQDQFVVYHQDSLDAEGTVLLDPNKWSEDGTTTLSGMNASNDGRYLAYGISNKGSDWNEMKVLDMETRQDLSDQLNWIKFGGAQWYRDGFFYSRFPEPEGGTEYSAQTVSQRIYYHRLGDPQERDTLIYEDIENPLRYNGCQVTEDERFLILTSSEGTSGNNLRFKDLANGIDSPWVMVVDHFKNDHHFEANTEDALLVRTNLDAPNFRLVRIDVARPDTANWTDVLPNRPDRVLTQVSQAGNRLVAVYMKDASDYLSVYTMEGKLLADITLPGIGAVGGISASRHDSFFHYTFTSFTWPSTIYRVELDGFTQTEFFRPEVDYDPTAYETKQVFYTSKDGTRVPMFLTMKKGLPMDNSNPTMLYGYGGFNISLPPAFSANNIVFLEQGGIYAQANLRGGSEYGEVWHKGGMLLNKQNVFDDFISAAEYLISEGYTSSSRLAIKGRSNGGLLVGTVMNQRPELFAVALPGVGVMDMLRYHKFTVGYGWVVEYGSSDDSIHFDNLYRYSPLHNLREGVNYPATLVTTADHDDRVVPAHSFKYIATLQEKHRGPNPVLIRIDVKAGHGAGKPISMLIEEEADVWAFTLWNLGVKGLK